MDSLGNSEKEAIRDSENSKCKGPGMFLTRLIDQLLIMVAQDVCNTAKGRMRKKM